MKNINTRIQKLEITLKRPDKITVIAIDSLIISPKELEGQNINSHQNNNNFTIIDIVEDTWKPT